MSPTTTLALAALATALGAFAALSALPWLRRLVAERPARRRGMILNLARRAGPPVLAGGAVLLLGQALGAAGTGLPAALLVAGGAAFGLHRGLDDIGQNDRRFTALRAALALAAATGYLWLAGLSGGASPL